VGFVVAERAYRPRVPGGRSTRRAGFTLSPEEAAILEERAAAAGLSVSVYVAGRALSAEGEGTASERRAQLRSVWELQRELSRVALQLAGAPGAEDTVAELRSVVGRLGVAADGLVALGVRS
jgi:hypothetical protein